MDKLLLLKHSIEVTEHHAYTTLLPLARKAVKEAHEELDKCFFNLFLNALLEAPMPADEDA